MKKLFIALAALMMVGCSTTPKDANIEIVRNHVVKQLTAYSDITVDADKIEITKCNYSVANPVLLETAISLAQTDHDRYLSGGITKSDYMKLCNERLSVAERVISSWIDAEKVDSLRYKADEKYPTYKVVAPFKKYSVVDDTLKTFVYLGPDGLVTDKDVTDKLTYLNDLMFRWMN